MGDKARMGGAAFDSKLMLRAASAGDLDENEAGTGVALPGGTPARGATARIVVPQATGTDPTLDVEIQECATQGGTYATVAKVQITEAGEYAVRFGTQKGWVRHNSTVGGTTPNFGAVQIGVVP